MSDDVTFRDFAGALMGNDDGKAASVLEALLGIDAQTAHRGTAFFRDRMAAQPDFMMKAMGMRTAVEAKDEALVTSLLRECFDLDGATATEAGKVLLARYV